MRRSWGGSRGSEGVLGSEVISGRGQQAQRSGGCLPVRPRQLWGASLAGGARLCLQGLPGAEWMHGGPAHARPALHADGAPSGCSFQKRVRGRGSVSGTSLPGAPLPGPAPCASAPCGSGEGELQARFFTRFAGDAGTAPAARPRASACRAAGSRSPAGRREEGARPLQLAGSIHPDAHWRLLCVRNKGRSEAAPGAVVHAVT